MFDSIFTFLDNEVVKPTVEYINEELERLVPPLTSSDDDPDEDSDDGD